MTEDENSKRHLGGGWRVHRDYRGQEPPKLDLDLTHPADWRGNSWSPRLGSLMWCLETSNNVRTSFVLLRSSLWAPNLAGMEFDFPVIMPLLQSHCSFSFVLGLGISFLVASSVLLLVVQQLVLILVFSQEKMSTHLSNLPPFLNLHSKVFMTILYLSGYNHQYTVHDNILTLLQLDSLSSCMTPSSYIFLFHNTGN